MGMLDMVQGISKEPHNKLWVFMGMILPLDVDKIKT